MKQIFSFCCVCVLLLSSGDTFAAKTYSVTVQGLFEATMKPSCSSISENLASNPDRFSEITCPGFEEAFAALPAGGVRFTVKVGKGSRAGDYTSYIRLVGGSCKAGQPAGTVTVPLRYQNSETGKVLQVIREAGGVMFSKDGCQVRGVSEDGLCVGFPRDGVSLLHCGVVLQETGSDGGPDSSPDMSEPGYTGGDGSGEGPGTTPGDGGGGTGGGDGGTGGGDGGSGGGGSGGGGSGGGGSGGEGGTGGEGGSGGNGGSGGTGGGSCGGPGQSPCKIDETGTPDGKGLFDRLTEALDSLANGIQAGVDSATSGDGKDTRISLGFQRPDATCTDPSVDVPVLGRSFSIPICQYISMIGMGFDALWSVFFIFAVMGLVSRATAKPIA